MFGNSGSAGTARTVPLAGPAPTPMASNGRAQAAAVQGAQEGAKDYTPWVLVALLGLYVVWSLVERHQRVRSLVQPKNLAINLRNLGAIVLPVILGLALIRLLLVKAKVWLSGIPYVSDLVGALIHVVGS
ncbi:MAG TPA: hypothetical protein VJX92_15520 [Methylomirabilota bacterium]|nr:hypothetical protein [Methylomirabilota bacterium]